MLNGISFIPILSTCFKTLQVIKNPVTDHLPTGCAKIGTSYHSDELVDIRRLVREEPMVFVVGAMAHGKVNIQLQSWPAELWHEPFFYTQGWSGLCRERSLHQWLPTLSCPDLCQTLHCIWRSLGNSIMHHFYFRKVNFFFFYSERPNLLHAATTTSTTKNIRDKSLRVKISFRVWEF